MKKRRGQKLKAWAALALLRFSAALPLSACQWLGRRLGALLRLSDNSNRRAARLNLAHCLPELSASEREKLLRQNLKHLGMTTMEGGPVWLWSPDRLRALVVEVDGEEHFEAALATGKPLLIAAAHFGNWELLAAWFAARLKLCALYRPPKLPELDDTVKQSRLRLPMELAPADHGGVRALLTALKAGKSILTLVDHEPSRGSGVFTTFFGQPAYTGVLAPRLARKTGAQVLVAGTIRLPDARGFRLRIRPGPDFTQLPDDDATAAGAMNAALEDLIRSAPEQFLWNYKRFRTQQDENAAPFYRRDERTRDRA